ncbi:MAG: hypothetical protein ACI4MY_07075 [Christensenellales bacterium]
MDFILELLAEIFFDGAIEFIKNPKFNLVWRIIVLVLVSTLYVALIAFMAIVAIKATISTSNTVTTTGKVALWLILCFVVALFITFLLKLISALRNKPNVESCDEDDVLD